MPNVELQVPDAANGPPNADGLPAGGQTGPLTSSVSPPSIVVRCIDPLCHQELADVQRLYRAHSATLGFFPQGAMAGLAADGTLLVAVEGVEVLGYLAYRVTGTSAKVIHLCVGAAHRGRGVARVLAEELFRITSHLQDVRLWCREDYPLTNFWPRLGFVYAAEKSGRGKEGKKLFLWVRRNATQPLLAALDAATRGKRQAVVIDMNVFLDFDRSDDRAQESKGLLADWLTDEVILCVTAELYNEFSRHSDAEIRSKRNSQASEFLLLEASAADARAAYDRIADVLPPAVDDQDESDRRHLAHAVAKGAPYFITRDGVMLEFADILRQHVNISVLRPIDFLLRLHAVSSQEYEPIRLVGTSVKRGRVTCEADLQPFFGCAAGETKARWLHRMRSALADPKRYATYVVSVDERPLVAYSVEATPGHLNLHILRGRRDPLTPTLLRRVVAEVLASADVGTSTRVSCVDTGGQLVNSVLGELGFVAQSGSLERYTWRTVLDVDSARVAGCIVGDAASALPEVEQRWWPLKLSGANIASFVVPIRPHWAAQLFDARLAEADLFGAMPETALALENVYYSSSNISIPVGARILWYVSDPIKSVRACSISLGSVRASARDLFRSYRRLGTYRWADLMRRADGNVERLMHAYRFAYTERFVEPVRWAALQDILIRHNGHGNPLAGPVAIPEQVFLDVYRPAAGH